MGLFDFFKKKKDTDSGTDAHGGMHQEETSGEDMVQGMSQEETGEMK